MQASYFLLSIEPIKSLRDDNLFQSWCDIILLGNMYSLMAFFPSSTTRTACCSSKYSVFFLARSWLSLCQLSCGVYLVTCGIISGKRCINRWKNQYFFHINGLCKLPCTSGLGLDLVLFYYMEFLNMYVSGSFASTSAFAAFAQARQSGIRKRVELLPARNALTVGKINIFSH